MARSSRKRATDVLAPETLPPAVEGASTGTGSIIPSPGPAPTTPPITQPISHTGSYTVAAGETVHGQGLAWLFESGSYNYLGPLVNNGVIWSTVNSANPYAFTYMSIGRYNNVRDITNNGLIVLETGPGLVGLTTAFSNTNLVNSGSLYVLSHGTNGATGVEGASRIDNSGLIAVRSDNGGGVGLILSNGGEVLNRAGARLLVEGTSATAIIFGDSPLGPGMPSRIINDGRIEARATGDDYSIAILASHLYGRVDLINTGVIKADFAYVSTFGTTTAGAYVDAITNSATGRIEGLLLMDRGDDIVINQGVIVGDIYMEEGADLVDTRGGRIDGVVDLGWGADRFLGGDHGDRVAGGDGDDRLEGGGGDDLLMGGSNNDVLIGDKGADGLFGEYGDDRIITQGADFVMGGAGDDIIEAGDFAFERIDGGEGFDTLKLAATARALDLSVILAEQGLADIEAVVMAGGQSLCIRADDVTGLTGGETSLRVTTTGSDRLDLVGAWTSGPDQVIGGVSYRAFSLDGRTVLVAGAGAVIANAAPSGGGLDPLTGSLAPLPGPASGLGVTSNVAVVDAYELSHSITVNPEAVWTSLDGHAVLTSFAQIAVINHGVLSSFRSETSRSMNPAFVVGGGSNNIETIINHGLISLENRTSQFGGGTSFAIASNSFSRVTNHGTIEASSLNGRVSAISAGGVENHGSISATAFAGPVIGIDLKGPLFQNHGDISVHCGGRETLSNEITWQGRPFSVGVVAYAGTHANYGTITATSVLSNGSVGIWFEVNGGATEVFTNAGVITADVAIHVRSDPYYGGGGVMHLTNTNLLDGRVVLAGGADRVTNTGVITGAVDLGAGADTFDGRGGVQSGVINAGDGDDVLWGGTGDETFNGGMGADTINGGDGTDTAVFSGLRSAYTISTTNGVTTISGPDGVDVLTGIEHLFFADGRHDITGAPITNYVYGTPNNDTIEGTPGQDVISAGAGDDIIRPGLGNDTIDGGGGRDTVVFTGTMAQSTVTLNGGTVTVTGPGGTDALTNVERLQFSDGTLIVGAGGGQYFAGTANADTLSGTAFNDEIDGLGGDDVIHAGAGDDLIDGGAGFDTVIFAGARSSFTLSHNGATMTVTGPTGTDVLRDVERLSFDNAAVFSGGAGADTLVGTSARDEMFGGDGDDVLIGGGHNDLIDGGAGIDTSVYTGNRSQYSITTQANGQIIVNGQDGFDTLTSIERLRFQDYTLVLSTTGHDTLYGTDGIDRIDASFGDDIAYGGGGNDTINGGDGADTVFAGTGDDLVSGDNGNDVLSGEDGDDKLYGGAGDDTLSGGRGANLLDGGAGHDVVVLSGARSEYRLLEVRGGFVLKGPQSGDRLVNVEELRFSDGKVINLLLQSGPDGWGAFVEPGCYPMDDDALVLPAEAGREKWAADLPQVLPADEFIPLPDAPETLPGLGDGKIADGPWVLPADDGADAFSGRVLAPLDTTPSTDSAHGWRQLDNILPDAGRLWDWAI